MSTLAGLPIKDVSLAMGLYGSWRADVVLAGGEPPTGQVTLVVADLELVGEVSEGGLDAPGRPHLVVVGGAGWERPVTRPLSYRSDVGVRLVTVLTDLAARAEEEIELPPDRSIGTQFGVLASSPVREERLRTVLWMLHLQGHVAPWRVDPDGVTRFGARPAVEVTARAVELERNAGVGWRRLGIDSPAAFLPGATFDGQVIRRLVVRDRSDKTEAVIWQ